LYDVAVIGAGPSGSYTSFLLAKENYNVLVLDKGHEIKESIICTGIVGEEAFQNFALPKKAILNDINSTKFIAPSGEVFRYQHSSTFAHILDRTLFDSSLIKQAVDEGVTFSSQSVVKSLRTINDGVEVRYKHQGEPASIKAKTVVLASGFSPSVFKHTRLKEPVKLLQGAQAEVDFDGLDEVEVYLGSKVAPGAFAWAVPSKAGNARLGLIVEGSASSYLQDFMMQPSIKRRLKSAEYKVGYRPVGNGMAKKTYCSRILAVGDAAGQVKSTTGGGIYYGLIGAEIAAQTLIEAFRSGDYSESHFRQYEKRWHERLASEIKAGVRLRSIFGSLGDKKINYLIDLANKNGIVPLIQKKAQFDWMKNFFVSLLKKPMVRRILF
jgi:digeranylgeranylglycerophospholipid reductase